MAGHYRDARRLVLAAGAGLVAIGGSWSTVHAQYAIHNLVSDGFLPADHMDSHLVNAWGLVAGPTTPWWVANNHTGTSTLYDGAGVASPLVVNVPGIAGGVGAPTGAVFNGSMTDFRLVPGMDSSAARFLFAGEDGTITGWAPSVPPPPPSTQAQIVVDNSAGGSIYKGIALGASGGSARLYAADFHNGAIDVFDSTFAPTAASGGFTDPNLPAGYAPFNVMNVGGRLLVTYALQDDQGEDDVPGAGHGFIDAFDFDGNLIGRLASGGALNSPWGLALAPSDFGPFSNDLLVGNFGDGVINAFDPVTGELLGTLSDAGGSPIGAEGLWGIGFGNGNASGPTNTLYFTAGPQDEAHGLFGSITIPAPGAGILALAGLGALRRRRA
jgi:uncharacterized protein (TIGR03118 family)